jgi:hypothetical protein
MMALDTQRAESISTAEVLNLSRLDGGLLIWASVSQGISASAFGFDSYFFNSECVDSALIERR